MQGQVIASDRTPGTGVTVQRTGFIYNWGPQAWIDMWMSNSMLVKKAMPIISHTFVPILRLSGDKEQVDRDYAEIKSRREVIHLFDAPREKWRKRYGNFVREVEWACLELQKYYSQKQYEDIVIGTSVALSKETAAGFLDMMNKGAEKSKIKAEKMRAQGLGPRPPTAWESFVFDNLNPAGWLTGPAKITEIDPSTGTSIMEIPECGWHVCADPSSLPNPDALPQEGCLNICKGPFERMFDGVNSGMKMEFDPHLPETSCTVRIITTGAT